MYPDGHRVSSDGSPRPAAAATPSTATCSVRRRAPSSDQRSSISRSVRTGVPARGPAGPTARSSCHPGIGTWTPSRRRSTGPRTARSACSLSIRLRCRPHRPVSRPAGVSAECQRGASAPGRSCCRMTPDDAETLVWQLISGDPEPRPSGLSTTRAGDRAHRAALHDPADPTCLSGPTSAHRPRERQLVALAAAHLAGDGERLTALAREHLARLPRTASSPPGSRPARTPAAPTAAPSPTAPRSPHPPPRPGPARLTSQRRLS